MNFDFWLKVIPVVFRPSDYSWFVIFVPPAVLIAALVVMRLKSKRPTKVWKTIGGYWVLIGWMVLSASVLSYFLVSYFSGKFDDDFKTRLTDKLSINADTRDKKADIRELAELVDKEYIHNSLFDIMKKVKGENRYEVVKAWTHSEKTGATVFYNGLYWPQKRIDEFKNSHNNALPSVASTGITYNKNQIELLEEENFEELNKSLSKEQWDEILKQYVDSLNKKELTRMAQELVDTKFLRKKPFKGVQSELIEPLVNEAYKNNESGKLAWLADMPNTDKTIYFLKSNIRWLRDLPWGVIWLIVSLIILIKGSKIQKDAKKNYFKI